MPPARFVVEIVEGDEEGYFDGFEELYDHASAPHEFTNLAADPKLARENARLRAWLEKVRAPLDGTYARKP